MNRCSPLALAAALCFTTAQAEMYRWVDGDGVTHFSQVPPPSGSATRLSKPAADPIGNSDSVQRINQQWQQAQDRKEERTEQREQQQEEAQLQARRAENCKAAKYNLGILQGPSNRLIKQPGGDYQRLTEEQRQAQISKAEEIIERDCD